MERKGKIGFFLWYNNGVWRRSVYKVICKNERTTIIEGEHQ